MLTEIQKNEWDKMFRDEDADEGADAKKWDVVLVRESAKDCDCGDCEEGLCSGKLFSLN